MPDNTQEVLTETHAQTRVITLNRPERHHAINTPMATQLMAAIDEAESDDSIKVIIMRGSGDRALPAFSIMPMAALGGWLRKILTITEVFGILVRHSNMEPGVEICS